MVAGNCRSNSAISFSPSNIGIACLSENSTRSEVLLRIAAAIIAGMSPFVAALGEHVGGEALDHFIIVGHAECDGFDEVVVAALREVDERLHAQLVAVAFAEDTQQVRRRKVAATEELFDGQRLQGGVAVVCKEPFPRRGAVLPEQFVHVDPFVSRREAEGRVADQVLFQIGGVFGQVADAHAQSREAHITIHPFVLQYVHRVASTATVRPGLKM